LERESEQEGKEVSIVKRILAMLMLTLFLVAALAVTASMAFAIPPGHGCVNKAEPPFKQNCFHREHGGG